MGRKVVRTIKDIEGIEYDLKSYGMDENKNECVNLYINNKCKSYKLKHSSKGKYIIFKGKRYYDDTITILEYINQVKAKH